jgi:hypothetical protein
MNEAFFVLHITGYARTAEFLQLGKVYCLCVPIPAQCRRSLPQGNGTEAAPETNTQSLPAGPKARRRPKVIRHIAAASINEKTGTAEAGKNRR